MLVILNPADHLSVNSTQPSLTQDIDIRYDGWCGPFMEYPTAARLDINPKNTETAINS